MPHLVITKQIAAMPATAWAIVSDFGDVSWIPLADDVAVHGEGVGMRRVIGASSTTPVTETLTSFDDDRMELGYSITDNPLPVNRFDALVSVHPGTSAAETSVTWEVDYDPAGPTSAEESAARQAIEAVYGMMAGWLADAASDRDQS